MKVERKMYLVMGWAGPYRRSCLRMPHASLSDGVGHMLICVLRLFDEAPVNDLTMKKWLALYSGSRRIRIINKNYIQQFCPMNMSDSFKSLI